MTQQIKNYPNNDQIIKLIEQFTPDIISQVTADYLRKHPQNNIESEVFIRKICREDMEKHLSFLINSIKINTPDVFSNYISWLKGVLEYRGLDTDHTSIALHSLYQQIIKLQNLDNDLSDKDWNIALNIILKAIEDYNAPLSTSTHIYKQALLSEHKKIDLYTKHIIDNNHSQASDIVLDAMIKGSTLTEANMGIIQPSMYEVGNLWRINKVSVAQEHLATAISQHVMTKAYANAEFKPPNKKKALFACIEGNHHALGLRMISDAFSVEGWNVSFLGENTPTQSIIKMIDDNLFDFLAISISMDNQVISLASSIDRIKSELGTRTPPIIIGGLPLNSHPEMVSQLGADAYFSNPQSAIEQT